MQERAVDELAVDQPILEEVWSERREGRMGERGRQRGSRVGEVDPHREFVGRID